MPATSATFRDSYLSRINSSESPHEPSHSRLHLRSAQHEQGGWGSAHPPACSGKSCHPSKRLKCCPWLPQIKGDTGRLRQGSYRKQEGHDSFFQLFSTGATGSSAGDVAPVSGRTRTHRLCSALCTAIPWEPGQQGAILQGFLQSTLLPELKWPGFVCIPSA